ncbi:MAG: pyrimidine dimer DNA glycosylase/endonuclease V [Nanoarchaeota archaeon]
MRQWNVPAKLMCRQHLLGEHREGHMIASSLMNHQRNVVGYVRHNLMEPLSLFKRHNELVREMKKRGYKHHTPLKFNQKKLNYLDKEIREGKINKKIALKDLISRCIRCKKLYNKYRRKS